MIVCRSHYSLLRGASPPAALVDRARELGMKWLALADDEGLYGAVEFWKLCKAAGLRPILGARVDGRVHLARNRAGYAALCRLITARKLGTEPPADLEGLIVPPRVEDVLFATPEGFRVHRLLSAIRQNALVAHVEGLGSPEAYLRPETDPEAERIAEACYWEFLPAPKVFPRDQGGPERLRALCEKGLAWRYPAGPPRERLEHELGVIGKLGYADYFLVVHDIVRHSRERGVPVAGRGSGASSLAAYVLGITNVCPVTYHLPFERFLHEGRADYPDLDVDFCWRIRDEVLAYVFDRFRDAAMVSTHITFQERSAFREAARAFGYSNEQVSLMQRGRAEPPDLPKLRAAAGAILGFPRHLSVHCGGVVLHPDGTAPLERAEKGVLVTQYDKRSVEEAGLVKIDLLGNRALSAIRETVEIVGRTSGTRIDVERLPADEATARLLREGRTLGCNQLESPGMRALLRMIRPADAKGLMQALALIRPGAASLGMKERFIRRARGLEPAPPGPLLGDTHGIMLYEDDAMLVASALAGVSLPEGDRFRRRVQKLRTDEERRAVSREFLGLCTKNGTPMELAKDLWIQMAKFSRFSFCRAHAASYAVIAWASAWLAAHHPAARWVAALNNNQGLYDARVYLEQARREGIRVLLPCVQRSGVEFSEEGGAIRVGLGRIFGLERRETEAILETRPFESLEDFLARAKVSWPSMRNLVLSGALDWTGRPRPQVLMAARAKGLPVPPVPDFTEEERFAHEFAILGLSARRHVLSYCMGPREPDSRALGDFVGRRIRLVGIMATARITETLGLEPMEFLTLEDEHGLFEAVLFPAAFRRYSRLVGTLGPYVVEGRVEDRYGAITISADWIAPVAPVPACLRRAGKP
jgi:DNA polymerase III alpha subunit